MSEDKYYLFAIDPTGRMAYHSKPMDCAADVAYERERLERTGQIIHEWTYHMASPAPTISSPTAANITTITSEDECLRCQDTGCAECMPLNNPDDNA